MDPIKDQAVKMQPIHQDTSLEIEKRKMFEKVFKRADFELDDMLFEFCKLCLINREIINRILQVVE
jgi:hypothetical protein